MYCLSQFCCFCFRGKVKLKPLHKISHDGTKLHEIAKIVIPELQFPGPDRLFFSCDDCETFVTEMYSFRRTSVRNNLLMMEYVGQLRSFGGEIGNLTVKMIDVKSTTFPDGNTVKIESDFDGDERIEYVDCGGSVFKNVKTEDSETFERTEDIVEVKIEPEMYLSEDMTVSGDENGISSSFIKKERDDYEENDYDDYETAENPLATKDTEMKIEIHDHITTMYGHIKNESSDVISTSTEKVVEDVGQESQELSDEPERTDCTEMENPTSEVKTGDKPFKCDRCEKSFSHKRSLDLHDFIHTGDNKCIFCGKLFSRLDILKKHLMVHTGEAPFKCEICDKTFAYASNFKIHNLIHTTGDAHKCDVCGKSFSQKEYLRRHYKIHTGETKCEICGKSFTNAYTLKFHRLTHTGEKPYKCDVCGRAFSQKSQMKSHQLSHTGEKPAKNLCEICGKSFTQINELKRHNMMHMEKVHKCDVCEKSFSTTENLTKHKLLHKKKQCRCDVCGKTFLHVRSLQRHNLIHTGDKPFKCDVCGKAFSQTSILKNHQMIHTGEKPFECNICGKSFARFHIMKYHIHAVHTQETG